MVRYYHVRMAASMLSKVNRFKYDDDIWQPTFETVEEQKLVLWKIFCWASTLFHPSFRSCLN